MKNLLSGRKKSTPRWKIVFQKSAYKEYQKLPQKFQEKIDKLLERLKINPFDDVLNFRKIQGREHFYRIRVGNYRIVYTLKKSILIIFIIRIGHRKDIYKFF